MKDCKTKPACRGAMDCSCPRTRYFRQAVTTLGRSLGLYQRAAMVLSSRRTPFTKPGWSVARKDADCAATPRR